MCLYVGICMYGAMSFVPNFWFFVVCLKDFSVDPCNSLNTHSQVDQQGVREDPKSLSQVFALSIIAGIWIFAHFFIMVLRQSYLYQTEDKR